MTVHSVCPSFHRRCRVPQWVMRVALATTTLLPAALGCSKPETEQAAKPGSVALAVEGVLDAATVSVSIEGAGMSPLELPLQRHRNGWGAAVSALSAGTRVFKAEARDASGKLLRAGEATAEVIAGQSIDIRLFLSELDPQVHHDVAATLADVQISPAEIGPGDRVTLEAHGKLVGTEAPAILISVDGRQLPGTDGKAQFEARATPGLMAVTIVLKTAKQETEYRLVLEVTAGRGKVAIVASDNQDPTVIKFDTPSPLLVGKEAEVSVEATDPEGKEVTSEFSSDCGAEIVKLAATRAKLLLQQEPATGTCVLQVEVKDADGGRSIVSREVPTSGAIAVHRPPRLENAVSPLLLAPGEKGYFSVSVAASDPAPEIDWKLDTLGLGALGTVTTSTVDGVTTSRVEYLAPNECFGPARSLQLSARVRDLGGTDELPLTATVACTDGPGFTPPGDHVVTTPAEGVQVTFTNVEEGLVTATSYEEPGKLPGFDNGQVVDIERQGGAYDEAEVCLDFDSKTFVPGAKPMLLHFTGGVWVDETDRVDDVNGVVCGRSDTLSPWMVAAPAAASLGTSHTGCFVNCGTTANRCKLQGGGMQCGLYYKLCTAQCDGQYPASSPGGTVFNFGRMKLGASGTQYFSRQSPIGGGIFGNGKKGMRVSFTPAPNVSGTSSGDWGLPWGNSFELKLGENQNVAISFTPTSPGRQAVKLYKWHVLDGNPVFGEEFTLVGEAIESF